jgi:phosphate/sulfate permease
MINTINAKIVNLVASKSTIPLSRVGVIVGAGVGVGVGVGARVGEGEASGMVNV